MVAWLEWMGCVGQMIDRLSSAVAASLTRRRAIAGVVAVLAPASALASERIASVELGGICRQSSDCAPQILYYPGEADVPMCRQVGSEQVTRCCMAEGLHCRFDGSCCGDLACVTLDEHGAGSICVAGAPKTPTAGVFCRHDAQCRTPDRADAICGWIGQCCDGDCLGPPRADLAAMLPAFGDLPGFSVPVPELRSIETVSAGFSDPSSAETVLLDLGWWGNAAFRAEGLGRTSLYVSLHGFGSRAEADRALEFVYSDDIATGDVYLVLDEERQGNFDGPWSERGDVRGVVYEMKRDTDPGTPVRIESGSVLVATIGQYLLIVRETPNDRPVDDGPGSWPLGNEAMLDIAEPVAARLGKFILDW